MIKDIAFAWPQNFIKLSHKTALTEFLAKKKTKKTDNIVLTKSYAYWACRQLRYKSE